MRESKKIKELRVRANNGESQAQCSLALRFFYGRGVEKDSKTAVNLLKEAADGGHVGAQELLKSIETNSGLLGRH